MVRNVRGAAYMKVFNDIKGELREQAQKQLASAGRLSIQDVGDLANAFDLPIKTTFNYLEYLEILPTGTWDRLADRGLTAGMLRSSVATSEAVSCAIE